MGKCLDTCVSDTNLVWITSIEINYVLAIKENYNSKTMSNIHKTTINKKHQQR